MTGGSCASPGCMGLDWYYNLLIEYAGQGSGHSDNVGSVNGGNLFPNSKSTVQDKLMSVGGDCNTLLLIMMDTKTYHQVQKPFVYNYTQPTYGVATTTTTTTRGPTTTTTTSTTTSTTTRKWAEEPLNRIVDISTYVANGMAGGSLSFLSVFEPKLCSELEDWELPHLSPKNVSEIAVKISEFYGDHSLCISVFQSVLVICNVYDIPGKYQNRPWCTLLANIIAEIIDIGADGVIDNADVLKNMRTQPYDGHYLFLRSSSIPDASQEEMVKYIGTTVTIKQELSFTSESWMTMSRRDMVEQVIHVWQHSLSKTYPSVFGVNDTDCPADMEPGRGGLLFYSVSRRRVRRLNGTSPRSRSPSYHDLFMERRTDVGHSDTAGRRLQLDASNCPYGQNIEGCNFMTSTLLQCAFLAVCNWYTPDMCCSRVDQWASGYELMTKGGYCASPSCIGIEFFYNIISEWSGQGSGYSYNVGEVLQGGLPFPRNRFSVETALRQQGFSCQTLLDEMAKPEYALIPGPLYYNYAPASMTRTTTSTTTTSTTTTSTTSTTTTSTTTTQTVTTTTSTTTTLPEGVAAVVKGSVTLAVQNAITFIHDDLVRIALGQALAETAFCPEAWVTVELQKTGSRWLQAIHSTYLDIENKVSEVLKGSLRRLLGESPQHRRLAQGARAKPRRLAWGVLVDYTIVVPANNPEQRTGMGALEAIMRAPLSDITLTMRTKVKDAIGTSADIEVTSRSQPSLGVYGFVITTTTTTTSVNITIPRTSGAPGRPSLHTVVILGATTVCWILIAATRGS